MGTVDVVHVGELLRDEGIEHDMERGLRREHMLGALHLLAAVQNGGAGDWAVDARCKGQTEVMFPERGASASPARAICAECPVIEQCREWAGTVPMAQSGIIAGLSGRQRRELTQVRLTAAA